MMLIQDEQVVVDPTRAWWTSVQASPVDGSESTLVANFTMPPDSDAQISSSIVQPESHWPQLIADADDQTGQRSGADQSSPEIHPSWTDPFAFPVQTVIGTFESESRAQIAANYLASFEQIRSSALWVLAPRTIDCAADGEASLSADVYWDDPYWEPVRSALSVNRAVLIMIVHEAGTSQAQAILAQDTGSLHTAVLPRPPPYVPAAPPLPQTIGILSAVPVLE